jgi:hypothetical protein
MKRWYIARMGNYDPDQPDVVCPAVAQYTESFNVWSKKDFAWAFGKCAASNMQPLQDDPDIYILPDAVLDMSWASVPAGTRTTFRNRIEAAGFSYSGTTTGLTIRQVLIKILKQLQPALNSVEDVDIADVE